MKELIIMITFIVIAIGCHHAICHMEKLIQDSCKSKLSIDHL